MSDLKRILDNINPALLTYTQWLSVGMALKHEGEPLSIWDDWSRRDTARYHRGECARKWDSFNGTHAPVTGATIVQLAKEQGWIAPSKTAHKELEWDATIAYEAGEALVDKNWIEDREVCEPEKWEPARELIKYLSIIFESEDKVGYVTQSWKKDSRYLPGKGAYDRTAGELISQLKACGGDIGSVIGDYDPEAGAWIRFNPLDGAGVKNANVVEYKYALIESDDMPIDTQNAIIRELRLPVACLVHSGKKSLHAIVKVQADTYDIYRKRVDYLYEVCRRNGLHVDTQNRNPSRLSRMPGVMRAGRKQFLVDCNIGMQSFREWEEWIADTNDELPEPETLQTVWDNMPDLAEPLIENVLRKGHKLLLAGPSKAGKSYALIELCCAIAEGRDWLGWQCAKGRVLYVNLELDRPSCLHRFRDVYEALSWQPRSICDIDIWNLRGKSVPMDKLAPKLIRRAAKKDYIAIVIDPIYKVITGDENSADQMAFFCNQFDRVCHELGAAVIYCHHHSKGAQGNKRAMDRASGSGVFARDPDALLDLIELETDDAIRERQRSRMVCDACVAALNRYNADALDAVPREAFDAAHILTTEAMKHLGCEAQSELRHTIAEIDKAAAAQSAWRIDGTLREFVKFAPKNIWFSYPVHKADDAGLLSDISTEDVPQWQKAKAARKSKTERKKDRAQQLEEAVNNASFNGQVTIKELAEYLSLSEKTIRRRVDESAKYTRRNGEVSLRTDRK